jgi:hypothetical protein
MDAQRARELLEYDPAMGTLTAKVTRNKVKAGMIVGTVNGAGYVQLQLCGKLYLAHRLAWLIVTGEWPPASVDHIDGNPLNNSWANLRCATHQQNLCNRPRQSNNKIGLKGVSRDRRTHTNPWRARITVKGKSILIGAYPTPEEAHAAYIRAASKMHGEFARA